MCKETHNQSSFGQKDSNELTYTDFTDSFIHPMVNLLNSSMQPRISEYIEKILQFSEHNMIGDWYLYQNHTEIRVYGSSLVPYKLPKYLPIRLFSLEYIRHILNSDAINFLAAKKKTQFKFKIRLALLSVTIEMQVLRRKNVYRSLNSANVSCGIMIPLEL